MNSAANSDTISLTEAVQIVSDSLSHRNCRLCEKNPAHSHVTWSTIIGLALLLEAEGMRRHRTHTLSHSTRTVFRTQKPLGKALFTIGWAALTFWFVPHVIKETQ